MRGREGGVGGGSGMEGGKWREGEREVRGGEDEGEEGLRKRG